MIIITLGLLFLILISFGLVETYFHRLTLAKLPIRIHVNGSRGKSSVARLIAAGLRAGGLKTLAKTTGTAPRIIDENGQDRIIHRLRSASIGEQVKLLRMFAKKKPDAVVIECMAVNPQYQWVSEHKMIKSTISVITNVRPDHLDEMGLTLYDNAMSLSNTIPFQGKLVTVEGDINKDGQIDILDKEISEILADVSEKRKTEFHQVSQDKIQPEYMNKFPYLEHSDNVAIALKVCELNGINEQTALDGMLNSHPDPGATIIWELYFSGTGNYFVNALAANDPTSTLDIWNQLQDKIKDSPVCIFLNTRDDRRYRTHQLLQLIFTKIQPNVLIVRGENLPSLYYSYKKENPEIETRQLSFHVDIKELVDVFSKLDNYFIVGIGNMVGWGEQFIQDLKKYRA